MIFKNETTSSTNSLHSWSLDGEQVRSTVPIANSYYRDGISYDARAGQIYWASGKSIYRQRSDGIGHEVVVNSTGIPFVRCWHVKLCNCDRIGV